MTNLECFGAYAADFEKTFKDDDWSRLDRYFAPDATYRVKGEPFAASIKGRDAIFKGIKKSLDGFDRRFATRDIALEGAPEGLVAAAARDVGVVAREQDVRNLPAAVLGRARVVGRIEQPRVE